MQSNKVAGALKIQMIATFKGRYGSLYLVFRYHVLEISDFKFEILNLKIRFENQILRS